MHLLAFAPDTPYAAFDIDPRKDGLIRLRISDDQFSWRLPLGSRLPARLDPETS